MDLALVTTEHEGVSVLAASGELDLATANIGDSLHISHVTLP